MKLFVLFIFTLFPIYSLCSFYYHIFLNRFTNFFYKFSKGCFVIILNLQILQIRLMVIILINTLLTFIRLCIFIAPLKYKKNVSIHFISFSIKTFLNCFRKNVKYFENWRIGKTWELDNVLLGKLLTWIS